MSLRERQIIANELHKPVRHHFTRRRVVIKGLDDLWQADLVEMIPYARNNKGYKYILMVIDTFSKYLWARPLKNKTATEVSKSMQDILKLGRRPANLQTDQGKEFDNANFQSLMKKYNINHYWTYSNLKASIVERVNRTIKGKMWKYFTINRTDKWFDILPDLLEEYNKTIHRTIGMKPADVTKDDEKRLKKDFFTHIKRTAPVHFRVGDKVRISKYRHHFAKGYKPNWTTEIFTIAKIQRTNPTTYLLQDARGEDILGAFYPQEMQKTQIPDVFLIDRIIRRKGNKMYVKWLGFSNEHNSWINKDK